MPANHQYRFCFGPWNLSEGQDPYGPTTRPPQTFDWKLAELKKAGFDAMMFHDDDAVPDIDGKSSSQIRKEAKELKRRLAGEGIVAEMVARGEEPPRDPFGHVKIDLINPGKWFGDRFAKLTDPFGHSWSIATHVEDVPPGEMAKRGAEAMKQMAAGKK